MVSMTPAGAFWGWGAGVLLQGRGWWRWSSHGQKKRVSAAHEHNFVLQPRKIEEIKDFLLTARQKDTKSIKIKKNKDM